MAEKSGFYPDVIKYILKTTAFKIVIMKYFYNYFLRREKAKCACAHLYVWSYLYKMREYLNPMPWEPWTDDLLIPQKITYPGK